MKDESIGLGCIDNNCYQCCKHTNMYLSNSDIHRIENLGYSKSFFLVEQDGWIQLKNQDGRCVFHNGTECTIYINRPEGCRLYPIVYDNDSNTAIIDVECPLHDMIVILKKNLHRLFSLIRILKFERQKRI